MMKINRYGCIIVIVVLPPLVVKSLTHEIIHISVKLIACGYYKNTNTNMIVIEMITIIIIIIITSSSSRNSRKPIIGLQIR